MGQKDSKVILQDSSASILFPFSFKDTHYFQKVSNLYNDTSNEGVVDFVGMFPSYGIAYVSGFFFFFFFCIFPDFQKE